jgi:hypothetical protein
MKPQLRYLLRDTAIIAGAMFSVFYMLDALLHPGKDWLDLVGLLMFWSSAAVVGWLYRQRNPEASLKDMIAYSAVLGIAIASLTALSNVVLIPTALQRLWEHSSITLLAAIILFGGATYVFKVIVAMRIGQWVYERAYPAGL